MSVADRIKEFRIARQLSYSDLSKNTGIAKSTLHRYENGATTKIPLDAIERIAEAFNVEPGVLMGWEDDGDLIAELYGPVLDHFDGDVNKALAFQKTVAEDALNDGANYLLTGKQNVIPHDAMMLDNPDVVRLRVFGSICAGNGGYVLEEDLGYEDILVLGKKKAAYNDTFCLKVSGDSMFPRVYPGDLVVIKPQRTADNGEMVAVIIDKETAVLKRLHKTEKGIILKSDNALYGETEYIGEEANRVYVVGKVIDMKAKRL